MPKKPRLRPFTAWTSVDSRGRSDWFLMRDRAVVADYCAASDTPTKVRVIDARDDPQAEIRRLRKVVAAARKWVAALDYQDEVLADFHSPLCKANAGEVCVAMDAAEAARDALVAAIRSAVSADRKVRR